MEADKKEQKWCTCKEPQPESSESDSESETSSSNHDWSSDDSCFSPFGPDGEPWGLEPYKYEPLATCGDQEKSTASNEIDYESRLTNSDWYVNVTMLIS